jgi:hypothetical protein
MRRFSIAVLSSLILACAPTAPPLDVSYTVFPTDAGADVLVQVAGGASDVAWVGFGIGPGNPVQLLDRIHSIDARDADGRRLQVAPQGRAGFRVDSPGRGPWTLGYSLDLRAEEGDSVFYRSSVRTDDYLVLVGSDAWARIYLTEQPLAFAPDNRPGGAIERATVSFHIPEDQADWRVLTTARSLTPHAFSLSNHPVNSVFAVGDFEVDLIGTNGGLRLAANAGWAVIPEAAAPMIDSLQDSLSSLLGAEPAARPALALLLPLPDGLKPAGGLRTAGMVRGETVLLYAGASAHRPDDARILGAMAVFFGHELFHLYVPSTVVVSRELSWLSEGWAMHMGRLAAESSGWIGADDAEAGLEDTYRRYLDFGGYRAGSLPAASLGAESQRDLLYLRGELVFRLLAHEWETTGRRSGDFEAALWGRLSGAYDGRNPLAAEQVQTIISDLVGPSVVRRYVEGTAPLTQGALGLGRAGR